MVEPWQCQICTFLNPGTGAAEDDHVVVCAMCQHPQGATNTPTPSEEVQMAPEEIQPLPPTLAAQDHGGHDFTLGPPPAIPTAPAHESPPRPPTVPAPPGPPSSFHQPPSGGPEPEEKTPINADKAMDVDDESLAPSATAPPAVSTESQDRYDDDWGDEELDEDGWGDEDEFEEPDSVRMSPSKDEESEFFENDLTNKISMHRKQLYRFYKIPSLLKEQKDHMARLQNELSISEGASEILLRHFGWNLEKALSAFQGKSKKEREELYKKAGCDKQIQEVISHAEMNGTTTCTICLDDKPIGDTFALACKHRYCLGCYTTHLQVAIKSGTASGAAAVYLTCPGYKCSQFIPKVVFEMLLDPDDYKRYESRALDSLVNDNPDLTWCSRPREKCGLVINLLKPGLHNIICECGNRFCYKCGEEAHAPASCTNYTAWKAKDKGAGALNAKYLKQCKPCPHCGVQTKKEGGCMYITCVKCRKAWCWQCGKSDHHVWECNRAKYGAEDGDENSEKYIFYYERYFNHHNSLRFAEDQIKKAEENCDQIELLDRGRHGGTRQAGDFLISAVKLVVECREVLRWTYVRAYYIKNDNEKRLFEHQQGHLEELTEKLSKLTENTDGLPNEVFLGKLFESRLKIMDITKVISKYLLAIITEDFRCLVDDGLQVKEDEKEPESATALNSGSNKRKKKKKKSPNKRPRKKIKAPR